MTMFRCADCQTVLLEYVYDALDTDDRALVHSHLNQCADCQGALNEARGQSHLLATAARLEFPAVQFTPPAPEPAVVEPEPVILTLPILTLPQKPVRVSWRRWAVVAASLFAVAVPAGLGLDYLDARRDLARHENAVARLDDQHNQLNEEALQLHERREKLLAERELEVKKTHLDPMVSGERDVVAHGFNEYQLSLKNGLGETVPGTFREVRVIDRETDKVVFEKKDLESNGAVRLKLPSDLPVNPGSRLTLQVVAAQKDGQQAMLTEDFQLTPATYLAHLYTDKPLYQPGETVRFRSLTLERFSLRPSTERLAIRYTVTTDRSTFEIPPGDLRKLYGQGSADGVGIHSPDSPLRGVGGGDWLIPPGAPGGEYTLTVSEDSNRFPKQQRKFVVNRFRKPRLMKEVEVWNRRTYGPGDEVLATCLAKTSTGPVKNCPVEVTVQVDGKTYDAAGQVSTEPFKLATDEQGKVIVRFRLPKEIEKGQASLNVNFLDGGNPDPLLKPIPIALKKLDVEFYPEGGYLVPHIQNRVYFQARTTLGKPADLKGRLMDDTGEVAALVETLSDDREPGVNQGMGSFRFRPLPDRKDPAKIRDYHLEIDAPAGITQRIPIKSDAWGVLAMTIPRAVTSSYEPIEVQLRNFGKARKLLVGAYCRGRLFDHVRVTAAPGQELTVTLRPALGVGGVYRVTVFEEEETGSSRPRLLPRAERLVYRQQRERLNLDVALARKSQGAIASTSPVEGKPGEGKGDALAATPALVPGAKVELDFKARGENQEPIPAVIMIAVNDQGVLKLADERTARSMPTHFLLTSEVRKPEELEFADFLLTNHQKASQALDLLLGTQGWRRFVEQKPGEVRKKLLEEAQALGAISTNGEVPRVTHARAAAEDQRSIDAKVQRERAKAIAELAPDYRALEKKQQELGDERRAALTDPAYTVALQRVDAWRVRLGFVKVFLPLIVVVLILLAGLLVARGLARSMNRAMPYFAASLACVALVVVALYQTSAPEDRSKQLARFDQTEDRGGFQGQQAGAEAPVNEAHKLGQDDAAQPRDPSVIRPEPQRPQGEGLVEKIAPKPEDAKQAQATRSGQPAPPMALPGPGRPDVGFTKIPAPRAPGGDGKGAFGALAKPGFAPGAGGFGGGFDQRYQGLGGEAKKTEEVAEPERGDFDRFAGKKDAPHRDGGTPLDRASRRQAEQRKALQNRFHRLNADKGKEGKDFDIDPATLFLREYAFERDRQAESGSRGDFPDTVFWHPALYLPTGNGKVSFELGDAVTTYQATVFGHTLDGRIAAAKPFLFDTRLPLVLDSAMPLEVTTSDKVIVGVTAVNNTSEQRDVELRFKQIMGLKRLSEAKEPLSSLRLSGQSKGRVLYRFQPEASSTLGYLEVEGETKGLRDSLKRSFTISPEGFPHTDARSDFLEGGQAKHMFDLPETWVNGTLRLKLQAFPSTLADLQKGLDGLLREPHGCFEQTSTTNYPNVMILSYLQESKQAKPEIERRARELLERGYQKLTSFECQKSGEPKREGYEWFGGTAPPHEALTAYGLLQFRDMARFSEVDREMLERTRKYLLSRRDGKGGFLRNQKSLDTFGRAPDHITDAYIVWALTESIGPDDFTRELDAVHEKAKSSKDPYFLALVANSLINRGKSKDALPLLQTAVGLQKDDGHVAGAETSITGSGGRDLQIETTALVLLGWLRADSVRFATPIDRAVKWLGRQRGDGGAFGSTQATILALKALIAHTKGQRAIETGTLTLWLNEQKAGEVAISTAASDALTIDVPGVEKLLKAGNNTARIEVTGMNQFPYTLGWSYQTLKPATDPRALLKLGTSLAKTKTNEGDTVRLTVKLENTSDRGKGMAVAIVGLPGGLLLPEDLKQLRGHCESPKDGGRPLLSTFEVRGRELILYWRDLAPKQVIEVLVDLSCRVPGEYSGPASRAYLYYNADQKTWVEPLRIAITPRGE